MQLTMRLMRLPIPRYLTSGVIAAAVTVGLTILMLNLIATDGPAYKEPPKTLPLDWYRLDRDEVINVNDRRPEPPIKPQVEPLTRINPDFPVAGGFTEARFVAPAPTGDIDVKGAGMPDGGALPIFKVNPIYPNRALSQGIEGYVILEFTIDELGRVVNPKVLEAEPSRIFDKAAMDAVQRFKYKPQVINGSATPVTIKHRVAFELT